MTTTFTVDGEPKGQPRPRAFYRKGLGVRVYDAGTAEGWKSAIAIASKPCRPASPLTCPVTITISLTMPRPKRLCRKCDAPHMIPFTSKPDVDNAAKAVLDAMTQCGWWDDDSRVWNMTISKRYAAKDHRPGAVVSVTWDETGSEAA